MFYSFDMKPDQLFSWVLSITISVLVVGFAFLAMMDFYSGTYTRLERFIGIKSGIPPFVQAGINVLISAAIATYVIRYFSSSKGELEFSALGIKLKGPSGPILLWVVSFIAVSSMLLLLLK